MNASKQSYFWTSVLFAMLQLLLVTATVYVFLSRKFAPRSDQQIRSHLGRALGHLQTQAHPATRNNGYARPVKSKSFLAFT
jgi:hypothetical protein